jgi:hypothetical protein
LLSKSISFGTAISGMIQLVLMQGHIHDYSP